MSYWFELRIIVAVTLAALSGKVVEVFWLAAAPDDRGWTILLLLLVCAPAIGLVGAGAALSGWGYAVLGLMAMSASAVGGGVAMTSLDRDLRPGDAFMQGFVIAAVPALAGLAAGGALLYGLTWMRRIRARS